jgi:hypothetical protein
MSASTARAFTPGSPVLGSPYEPQISRSISPAASPRSRGERQVGEGHVKSSRGGFPCLIRLRRLRSGQVRRVGAIHYRRQRRAAVSVKCHDDSALDVPVHGPERITSPIRSPWSGPTHTSGARLRSAAKVNPPLPVENADLSPRRRRDFPISRNLCQDRAKRSLGEGRRLVLRLRHRPVIERLVENLLVNAGLAGDIA